MDNRPYVSSRSSSGGQRPKWPCSRPPRRELLRRLLFYLTRAHYTHTRSQATCLSHALEEEQRDRHGVQGLPARISHRKSQGFRTRDRNRRKLFRVIYTRAVNRISENCMRIWKTRFPHFPTFIVPDFPTFIVPDFLTFIVPDFPTFIWPSFQTCKPSNLLVFRLLNLRAFRLLNLRTFRL